MSNQSIPLADLESSAALQFNKMGDKHAGRITAVDQRKQTDPKTGQVKTFNDGSPMMLWVITLDLPNGDTGALWAKGGKFKAFTGSGESMLSAIGTAVRAAGASSVDIGAQLAVAWTGEGEAKSGMNPPKLYTAQYIPAAPASVPVEDLFSQ
jgi:hypothetical protein